MAVGAASAASTTTAGLAEAFESARSEGLKAFGDATVFMERVVTGARHVEVQLIADEHGTAWAVGVRDCSMQRRNQKVIEESQCIVLTPEQDRDLRAAAVRLAGVAGYQNAGTVEFLYQPAEQRLRVPRGQHAPAGRAPGHRADDRARSRQAATARRGRRPAGGRAAADRGLRDRGPPQRRGPAASVRPGAGHDRDPHAAGRPGHPGRHRREPRVTSSRRSTTR